MVWDLNLIYVSPLSNNYNIQSTTMSFKKFIIAICILIHSEITFASTCQPPNIFYQFLELGACLPDDINVKKEKYDDYTVFNILYKNFPIRVELGSRQNGDIYTVFGKDFDKKLLHNLPPMPSYFGNGMRYTNGISIKKYYLYLFSAPIVPT